MREQITYETAGEQHSALMSWTGGKPVAYVDNSIARAGRRLSHGAVATFAACACLAAINDHDGIYFESPAGGWGAALGATGRAVRNWRRELHDAGLLEMDQDEAGKPAWWAIPESMSRLAVIEGAAFARVPIDRWPDPAWTPAMRRVWIGLWSFADGRTCRAWPSTATLAAAAGTSTRQVRTILRQLESTGRVLAHRRQRRATVFELCRAPRNETSANPGMKPPQPRNETAVDPGTRLPPIKSLDQEFDQESGSPACRRATPEPPDPMLRVFSVIEDAADPRCESTEHHEEEPTRWQLTNRSAAS